MIAIKTAMRRHRIANRLLFPGIIIIIFLIDKDLFGEINSGIRCVLNEKLVRETVIRGLA